MTAKQLIWALHGVEDLELKDCGLTTEMLEEFNAKEIVHAHWIYSLKDSGNALHATDGKLMG